MANRLSGGKSGKGAPAAKTAAIGRPRALEADDKTLASIRALSQIDATEEEMAAVLGVAASTFREFKKREPEVAEIIERGRAEGRVSLRRTMRRMAEKNPAMAIFLAKNKLGMADKVDTKNTGDIAIIVDVEDAEV
ncbi:hypothetical protein [Mesorhizobium sp. ORS 3428]|uniref:hypothetical protein n=1 Tax=Mesorhizobium sp. ORS 3428 TaxID=540997 RepID=UPI0010426421|nr:hypothetical protein [Mesorhizobium sp. ORS 3428]